MNTKEIIRLKEEITQAKTQVDMLTGKQQAYLQQLQKQWNCNDLPSAQKKAEKLKQEIQQMSQRIEKESNKLELKLKEL